KRLEECTAFQRARAAGLDDLGERLRAVDLRLPAAQASEIRTVEKQDAHRSVISVAGVERAEHAHRPRVRSHPDQCAAERFGVRIAADLDEEPIAPWA